MCLQPPGGPVDLVSMCLGWGRLAAERQNVGQQMLVIIGDTSPSKIDTVFYVIGKPNPLRTQSPYVAISATLDGVITRVE